MIHTGKVEPISLLDDLGGNNATCVFTLQRAPPLLFDIQLKSKGGICICSSTVTT